ncbi:hypothetical protein [Paenibacillus woosongensis]|uniref:Uncharacterized protein n=1 Tax=Paenibacillus woosongensis TaxID=307580 RepID=A0A7X2YYS0_9BACL|nr:hypothetical protein [Paenibacillus woosongensis]MUG44436.1 hypothetical protein [Paenibacillus woosongensis]
MKFKKMLTVLFTTVLLLTFSSAANAAVGFADTKAQAFSVQPKAAGNESMSMSLSSSNDVDWYKWTNNTGTDKFISTALVVFDNSSQSKYQIGHELVYKDGRSTDIFYAYDGRGISHIYVPAGATLYVRVEAKVFIDPSIVYWLFVVNHELD